MKHLLFTVFTVFILHSSFSLALAAPSPVPQTGQTTCYDNTGTAIACADTGQDGDTLMGIPWPSPRFTDNSIATPADQTVTDSLTGLIWTKNDNPGDALKNWQEALDYIKGLNSSNYLGHNDWRLPNLNELESMINKGEAKSSTWLNTQGFSNVQDYIYWSSSTYAGYPYFAWDVYMDGGNVYAPKYKYYHVWPVRAGLSGSYGSLTLSKTGQTTCYAGSGDTIDCSGTGQDGELQTGAAWPSPRFADNGDQTVTDNLTGLVWTKNANPAAGTKNWQDALDYIKTLNSSSYLGHNDWRLPNRNELVSMVNKGEAYPSTWLNTQGFPNVRDSYYWSSSSYVGNPNYAWEVDMSYGYVNANIKNYDGYVWPVRAGQAGSLVHLNISMDGNGNVTPDSGTLEWSGSNGLGHYLFNTNVTLTAAPDNGSSFAGWSGACSGTDPCTVTMDAAKSVFATFVMPIENVSPASYNFGDLKIGTAPSVQSFTLSSGGLAPLVVSGINIIGTNTSQFTVTPGTCNSLTPTLAPATSCTVNITFTPTVLGPKNATLHVTSNSVNNPTLDAQLTGIVIIPYYTLTITSQGTGSGRVAYSSGGYCTGNCSQSFASGRPLQLTPVADSGSQFSGWSGCDSVTGDVCSVTMTDAKSVVAAFTLNASVIEQWVTSGPVDGQIESLAINPSLPATIFAGSWNGTGVFRSDDGGSSWNPSNNGLTDTQISSLAINPLTPTTMYTDTANAGLFSSSDGGVSWSLVNNTLKGAQALTINPGTPATLYSSGCGGVCKSVDSGTSWNPVNNGISLPYLSTLVYALAINPTAPDILYAGAMGGFELNGGLFKSTDGGDSWIRLGSGLTDNRFKALAIDPMNPDTLYAGTDGGGVFKTTDAGVTWSPVNNGLTNASVRALAINPSTPSTIYAGTTGGVFRSTDNGDHWSPVNNGLTNAFVTKLAIAPTTPSTVYAGTYGGGVFKLTLVTTAPTISVSPSLNDFGAVATYGSSSTLPFTISNIGNADLLVTATTLTGANSGEFSLQPGSCTSLKPTVTPGASCTMEVTFVPTTIGSKSATLLLASNYPDNPMKSATLSGIAYDPPPIGMVAINLGSGFTNTTSVTLALAAFDNSGTVAAMRISNNNTSWSDWEMYSTSKAWTLTTLGGDGSKTVFVQFRDGAGNASGSFADSITLDTTPPISTITSMPGPFYPATDVTFTFSATESATFQCQLDSGPWGACNSPFSISGLTDGSHTFSVKATDSAGNLEATAKSYTFSIDTTAPDTTITGQPEALTNSASGRFTFSSPDTNAVFHCKLDSGAWSYCFSFSFSGVADGIHTFSVRAIDRSGNIDLTPATYTWTIDTTPPDSTLYSSVNGSSASFTVGSPDPTATLQCKLDSAVWAACSGAVNFTGLTNGSHTFSVRSTDPAGNVDPTPATYSWTAPCNVQIVGGSCYATIGEALTAVPDNGTIHIKAMNFLEAANFSYPKSLTFSGGYGPNFEPPIPGAMTTVKGFTISDGAMTVENLVVQ